MASSDIPSLELEWLPGRFAVCRLDANDALPPWASPILTGAAAMPGLACVVRTENELSIVIDEAVLPPSVASTLPVQRGFAAMRIVGTIDFALVGVLSRLTTALAAATISVFLISTFDTDIILVREADRERAMHALSTVAKFI